MAASTIFFNGRLISVPGSYSEVNASGLEQVGLGASGIIGVLGTAEGGKPVVDIEDPKDFIRITKPSKVAETFKSGNLLEIGNILFAPSKDPDVPGGAQEIVAMKVNPATQSVATLVNSIGDALDLTSKDYGAFTEQINTTVAAGTNKGKLVTITFEDAIEAIDDLGGDIMFNLKYTKPTNGWDAITAQVASAGAIECEATRDVGGLDSHVDTPLAAPGTIEIESADAGDLTQIVTIYGLDGTGAVVREVLTLTGTVAKVGTQAFGARDVLGAKIEGTTAGIVTVAASGGGATVLTIAAGADPVRGLLPGVAMYVSGTVATVVASAAGTGTEAVILVGTTTSGAVQIEKIALAGTTPVVGVAVWGTLTGIVLGDVGAALTLTLSAQAARANPLIQTTLLKTADYFNGRYIASTGGFVFSMVTPLTALALSDMDATSVAVSILDPADPAFYAELWAAKYWINQNSVLISAEYSSGATGGALSNTTAPIFLAGGIEGVATTTDWQKGLNLLKKARINTVLVLTADPAIHAILATHISYMCGIGRNERDGVVAIADSVTGEPTTKTAIKEAIVDLNTFHLRAVAQSIDRYNTDGERETFLPIMATGIVAGMQSGSPVGVSLTSKLANVLDFSQHNSWNPIDDAEEMIQAGLLFLENVENIGNRWVRNVTTHLSSSNVAYTEASVAEAWKYSVYTFRTEMEYAVGKPGFAGTENAARSVAKGSLGLLVAGPALTSYRSLDIDLVVDVLEVSVEMAPVVPISFVKNTIHLVTARQAA